MRNTILRLSLVVGAALLGSATGAVGQHPALTRPLFVVAANPLAADAGMKVLRRGGSATDAALAIQAMLSLVEPQSSGMGGGAFMTFYDGRTRRITVYDGRETAPAGVRADLFLGPDGKALPFNQAVVSGRATGVPGALKLLALAHDEHGRLAWQSLFGDAERAAREGFVVSPRLARFVHGNFAENAAPDVRAYFARPGGGLVQAGDRLRNAAYAEFLRRLAAQGPDALYRGPTAARIVARTHDNPLGGSMTLADLAGYHAIEREPVCRPFRIYRLCAPPPPASGVGLLELMGILARTDIDARRPSDPQGWYLFAAASRLMYADRDRYVGDPAFVQVPVAGLLDPAYLAARAKLIGSRSGPPPAPGLPAGAAETGRDSTVEPTGTSHFIIGDLYGNVVSMTTTVESIFGTGRMVDGFFLNNQLTDFAFAARAPDGRLLANAAAPGKRPRSSMTPIIITDRQGRFAGALGSAGGNAILAYVGKALIGAIDWKLSMQDAIDLPNLIARGGVVAGEMHKMPNAVVAGLRERGIAVREGEGEDSGIQGVIIREGRIEGGADSRREGVARIKAPPRRLRPRLRSQSHHAAIAP